MKRLLFMALVLCGASLYSQNAPVFRNAVITLPSTSITYTAGYAIVPTNGNLIPFALAANGNGRSGYIQSVRIAVDTANATGGSLLLTLYNDSTGINRIADNVTCPQLYTNFLKIICPPIPLTLQTTGGGTGSTVAWDGLSYLGYFFRCVPTSKTIYGRLVANGAWKRSYGGTITIELGIIQYNQ